MNAMFVYSSLERNPILMDHFVGILYPKDEMFKEKAVPRCLILAVLGLELTLFLSVSVIMDDFVFLSSSAARLSIAYYHIISKNTCTLNRF